MGTELTVTIDVAAPVELVWRRVSDWDGQRDWVPATRVEVTGGDGRSVGSTLCAVTGLGPAAFADPMEVTEFVEGGPWRAVVRHTGRVVRGEGVFEVVELGPGHSRFRWTERLDLPLGALGRAGWPVLRPGARAVLALSCRRLARLCEDEHAGG